MSRVLLADDSERFRAPVVAALEWRGHRVMCASDGQEALRAMQAEKPYLVVRDLLMPGVDGMTVLRTMRSRPGLQQIPVIVLTGKDWEHIMIEAKSLGAECLLKSCITLEELCARITNRLTEKHAVAS